MLLNINTLHEYAKNSLSKYK